MRDQIEKCQSQLSERNEVITDLKKQLKGKDSEIEVQVASYSNLVLCDIIVFPAYNKLFLFQRIASKAKASSLNASAVKFSPNRSVNHLRKYCNDDRSLSNQFFLLQF